MLWPLWFCCLISTRCISTELRRVRRQLVEQGQLFRLISENAVDMIALVDSSGRRLYNSPSYQKILGYSAEDLRTSPLEQIHPDDRQRVIEAAALCFWLTGFGQTLVYRIRHKNGTWRILELTASAVLNAKGQMRKLVIVNRDITERKRVEEMLAHNTYHDGLTNLPNRSVFLTVFSIRSVFPGAMQTTSSLCCCWMSMTLRS